MVQQAERHREADEQRKEEVEARNHADSVVYAAEKSLRELGDQVPEDVKSDVETKVQAVRDALAGSDVSLIKSKTEELGAAVQQIGASMYEQPDAAPGPDEAASAAADAGADAGAGAGADADGSAEAETSEEDVVEGEFEET
jgi:molecular chaperone DnaK